MNEIEERVLKVLDKPLRNYDIEKQTGLPRKDVAKALKSLRAKGHIISRGATAARVHMRLAAAIEDIYRWVGGNIYEIHEKLSNIERRLDRK